MAISKKMIDKIMTIYIVIQPVLDLFTGIITKVYGNTLSIGVVVRSLFMVSIALYTVCRANKKEKAKVIIYYGAIAVYSLIFLLLAYNRNKLMGIFVEVKGLIKTIYFPITLFSMYVLTKEKNIFINTRILVYTLLIYTLAIFLGKITGISFKSYNTIKQSAGTIGLFYSANEIGAILCILAPFLIENFCLRKGNMLFNSISMLLLVFSIFEIGTKAPFLGVIGAIFGIIIVSVVMCLKEKKNIYIENIAITLLIFLVCFVVIDYTPLGTNLKDIYGTFFQKTTLKENVGQEVKNPVDTMEEIQSILTSKRSDVLKKNIEKFSKTDLKTKLFRNGIFRN